MVLVLSGVAWGQMPAILTSPPPSGGGGGTVTEVHTCSNEASNNTVVTCAISVTSGNNVWLFAACQSTTNYRTFTVSDGSNSYTQIGTTDNNADRFISTAQYYAAMGSTASTTFTVTASGVCNGHVSVAAVEMTSTSLPVTLDTSCVGHNAAGVSSTAVACSSAMSLSSSTGLVTAGSYTAGTVASWTAGTGFTNFCPSGSCTNDLGSAEYKAGTSGTVNPGFTIGANAFWTDLGAAWK